MSTTTCPACRSINHEGVSRCMNCGSPMELPAVPVGVDLDDLPAAPPPQPSAYGWNAAVAQAPTPARGRSTVPVIVGVIAVVAFVATMGMWLTTYPEVSVGVGVFGSVLVVVNILVIIFWLWMLVDAISSSRVGWALAVFFLGVFGALAYALLGRNPRARY